MTTKKRKKKKEKRMTVTNTNNTKMTKERKKKEKTTKMMMMMMMNDEGISPVFQFLSMDIWFCVPQRLCSRSGPTKALLITLFKILLHFLSKASLNFTVWLP